MSRISVEKCDMSKEMRDVVVDVITAGIEKRTQPRDIARNVKQTMDEKFGRAWHCIGGREYFGFVSCEQQTYMDCRADGTKYLVFRCGK
ncbi:unnamed protein product [Calicophoron daubneyi]|uniref:Dynein light chain n=1 Tax=Calicophoron daubneyi TaxID=300641 RepID=A0AAV2TY03_CALDB